MTLVDEDILDEHGEEQPNLSEIVIRSGSAALIAQLLAAAAPQFDLEILEPALQHPASNSFKHNASSVLDLSLNGSEPHSSHAETGYSVLKVRHIGKRLVWHSPPIEQASAAGVSTAVLTGSGDAFQDVEPALDFLQRVKPKYIVHHMTRPLARGRLWDIIRKGQMVRDAVPDPDHLAVIIDADDLRAEGIALSRSLSWEATAEDFVLNLGSNGRLDTLVTCPNLIVRFGNEGVIHHRGRDAGDPILYFQPRRMEATCNHMIGLTSAFVAGFAIGFPDVQKGIKLGIAAAERLAKNGFTENSQDERPDYPIQQVMKGLTPQQQISTVKIPSTKISMGDNFSIFETLSGDISEVARHIVTLGPDRALARCPVRRLDQLQSADRAELESLGSIVDTMNETLDSDNATPTCIGMVGPVGSGKKFVAGNVSGQLNPRWQIRRLTYNAQVLRMQQLASACHAIRDNTADGFLTIVNFENCEALLRPEDALLDDFVALMRDGIFKDGDQERRVGKCLMILFINKDVDPFTSPQTPTTPRYDKSFNFEDSINDEPLTSNLHGVMKLSGPNKIDEEDKLFPIRRAFMLRHLLQERHPHLCKTGTIRIDDAVLYALLFIPEYKQGLRSLEKIISTSRLHGRTRYDVSALPPEEQIQLHVDGKQFMASLRFPRLQPAVRETLAEGLFETYKKERVKMADTVEKQRQLQRDPAMADWDDLPGQLKESTRAQADDIPRKLRVVKCFMQERKRTDDEFVLVEGFTEAELDELSEMEHERFNAERLMKQWRIGPRDSNQRSTPFIVPWRDLTQEWKDVDRVMVECTPRVLAKAGYYIYRNKEGE